MLCFIQIAVVIRNILQLNNQPESDVPLSKLIPIIQLARRVLAFESQSKEAEYTEDPHTQKADRQSNLAIDARIRQIQEALSTFKVRH